MAGNPIIFYADDDPDDRTWIKECLLNQEPNVTFREFEDGVQLIHHLKISAEADPNLVILDVNMPGMSGREVLKEIRLHPKWRHFKVVLFTNSSSEADRTFAQHLNAAFVTKPLSMEGIRKVTEQLLTFALATS